MHDAFHPSKSKVMPKRKEAAAEMKGAKQAPHDADDCRTPGECPAHRIPIFDHKGNMRGHVGYTASQATVARFLGRHGADLTDKDGRKAWVGHTPPPPPPPPTIIMGDGSAPPGADVPPGRGKPPAGKPKPGSKPPKGLK